LNLFIRLIIQYIILGNFYLDIINSKFQLVIVATDPLELIQFGFQRSFDFLEAFDCHSKFLEPHHLAISFKKYSLKNLLLMISFVFCSSHFFIGPFSKYLAEFYLFSL